MLSDPKFKSYLQYLSLGTEIAITIGAPLLFGFWLDSVLDTSPWLTLSGVLLSMILFVLMLMRLIRKLNRDNGNDS